MIAHADDITDLRAAGKILGSVLRELVAAVAPGVSTAALDLLAERRIREQAATPSFLNYKPTGASYPYPAALCVSVNDEVVHGIPTETTVLAEGDIVCVDLGLSYQGYFVDAARTVVVGEGDAAAHRLVEATREALDAAIAAARVGGRTGDIGAAVERVAKKYKVAIVEDLGGHAVGRAVHEKPYIANHGPAGTGEKLVAGMVLALEPMFAEGKGAIVLDQEDQWTYRMQDGSRAAHEEDTILLTKNGPEILTR